MIEPEDLLHNRIYHTYPVAVHAPGKPKERPWWDSVRRASFTLERRYPKCESLAIITWNSGPFDSTHIRRRGHTLGWFEKSLTHRGVEYTTLGAGIGEAWTNRLKLDLTIDFLAQCRAEFVMGADSSDALLIGDPQALVDRFGRLGAGMVFNAEKNFWPPELEAVKRFEERVCQGPFRYLNAGLWIGRRERCLEAFELARAWGRKLTIRTRSEQVCWKYAYRELHPAIQLDERCQIFQNLNRVDREIRVLGRGLPSPIVRFIRERILALRARS